MPVADLRASVSGGKACPNNCGGNGVCNSLGHCHCNRGFRPPDCTQPGVGGSEDSGPAEDPNGESNLFNLSQPSTISSTLPPMKTNSFRIVYLLQRGTTS